MADRAKEYFGIQARILVISIVITKWIDWRVEWEIRSRTDVPPSAPVIPVASERCNRRMDRSVLFPGDYDKRAIRLIRDAAMLK